MQGLKLTKRFYPNGSLAAHLLGYVGEINDEELTPRGPTGTCPGTRSASPASSRPTRTSSGARPGWRLEVDAKGTVLRTMEHQAPVQGHDLYLTLDVDVQKTAEESLAQVCSGPGVPSTRPAKHFTAPAGAAVVLDPDGSLVAMASYPTFDPNQFVNGISAKNFAALQDRPAASR